MSNLDRPVRPWDLFNKKMGRVSIEQKNQRLQICKECPFFLKITSQCKKCGCLMTEKTKLADAECPIGKWGKINVEVINNES